MNLDQNVLTQVRQIFASLTHDYIFRVSCNSASETGKEMIEFFTQFSTTSPRLAVEVENNNSDKSVTSLIRDGVPTGISFRMIPGGHEFTSLLLAVMNADGQGKTLPDEATISRIKRLKGEISINIYATLECTNCPDVIQALNQMALYNDNIASQAIDGNLAVAEAEALGVKSVPTVYANGELLWIGKGSLGELLDKLEEKFGSREADSPTQEKEYDLLVIGGGPAGASSAIYSARKGIKVGVVAQRIGGQVKETTGIENVISVLHTTGEKLANDLHLHMKDYDMDIYDSRTLESVELKEPVKTVRVKGGEIFKAPQVIIATGARWRRMNVTGEEEYIGHGIGFCVHCDGPFFKGKDVAVIGGGNSGIEAAIDLAKICNHVDVFEFMDTLKADTVLQDKVRTLSNVEVHLSQQVMKVTGDGKTLDGLDVKDRITGEVKHYKENGVFVQIGLQPNSEVFVPQIGANGRGEIIVDAFCRTDVPGVYAAGDVSSVPYKQIIIAMGEGAKAALSAFDDRIRTLN
ncbi:MAG: alkyl hydroperoxide reductase subunit F [Muribaculaceae bacterium]|nr:alkyl hydroperoxide reductase subunit F [Muribaculaceae bacterium]